VDNLDLVALAGLEWLYVIVEDRYGVLAAWIVTLTAAFSVLGVAVWVLIRVIHG